MNMIDYVYNALTSLNIPVQWNIRPSTYPSITYTFINSTGEAFGDGKEIGTAHYLQVDCWAKDKIDYINIVNGTKEKLLNSRFKRQTEIDLYEDNEKLYHKAIRFFYLENISD